MTKSQLVRDCKEKNIKLRMIYRFGNEIPERLKGVRTISRASTHSVFLLNASGQESELMLPRAALIDYDGEFLTIYAPAFRPFTDEERAVYAECQAERKRFELENPYTDSYWHMEEVYEKCPFPWIGGGEMKRGKKIEIPGETVLDCSVRGDMNFMYEVIR